MSERLVEPEDLLGDLLRRPDQDRPTLDGVVDGRERHRVAGRVVPGLVEERHDLLVRRPEGLTRLLGRVGQVEEARPPRRRRRTGGRGRAWRTALDESRAGHVSGKIVILPE
ncbi:hypothetical protein ACFV80_42000 [Streptomyces sp. NPDC059862]|uniref:hypothetical protein n=1 Tax=Streptomyces sp. NPDC059862 TaxID=3346975 RepID=UPI0036575386